MQHNVSDHQIFCASLCPHVLLSVACFLPRTGNTFSTLRGHRFDWLLLRDEEATHQTSEPEAILHFVRFDDSSYETDPIIGALEARGYYGDTVLVEGVSTGTAKVSVRFVDRVWKDSVAPATVKLLVIENIMLQPAMDVYILPYCIVHYTVERKKQGKTEVVVMPSDQYSLELTNTTVASLDTPSSNVTGLVVGDTEVVLQDKNMLHTPSATKPSAGVHVVPPHHLGYTISPDNIWVLEVGRQYQITVHVFDKFNHPILVTQNVVMKTVLPTSHLDPLSSSQNGSYHFVTAENVGKATIHATLNAVK
ncbi:Nuclear pore membrane glycoprotein 210 [Geodia barretti]|uniref:Nuclear pore membrane glycoprotein 210 n=1 Tax=Geodia barretti TaxID=519541 RepID=A0AA35SD51_GEOBA|nr:Nuclear pore membrane glycoprotein 210 [Geodia barretti]